MIQEICLLLLKLTAVYFLSINIVYGILMILSWLKIKKYRRRVKKEQPLSTYPPVSFIIPAFNEESLIVETIQTYLSLEGLKKEIIVINDGSHDSTFKLLQTMFQLQKMDHPTSKIFRSITNSDLRVLEAPHMGKAQALNFGIEHAGFDLVCTMDADTVPMVRGVEGCLGAFVHDPKLVACGGVIQVLNSHVLKNNSPQEGTPGWLTTFQRLEYLRTFVCERLGWSFLGSTLLISGAFCLVKKEAIKRIGGFRHDSLTEDFDLIVRLRKEYHGEKHHFKILPLTTCYTQVPQSLNHLKRQRMRWQMGLIETLGQNFSLFLHPGHGPLGLFAIPYFWLVEVFSPVLEGVAILVIPYALYQQWITWELVLLYLGIGVIFNLGITLLGIYFDNKYVSRKKNWSCLKSALYTILLHLGYKQLNSWWRFIALIKSLGKNPSWGDKPREEIHHQKI